MDRALVFGTRNGGSSPSGGTKGAGSATKLYGVFGVILGKKKSPISLKAEKKNFHKILSKKRQAPFLDFYGVICYH